MHGKHGKYRARAHSGWCAFRMATWTKDDAARGLWP